MNLTKLNESLAKIESELSEGAVDPIKNKKYFEKYQQLHRQTARELSALVKELENRDRPDSFDDLVDYEGEHSDLLQFLKKLRC